MWDDLQTAQVFDVSTVLPHVKKPSTATYDLGGRGRRGFQGGPRQKLTDFYRSCWPCLPDGQIINAHNKSCRHGLPYWHWYKTTKVKHYTYSGPRQGTSYAVRRQLGSHHRLFLAARSGKRRIQTPLSKTSKSGYSSFWTPIPSDRKKATCIKCGHTSQESHQRIERIRYYPWILLTSLPVRKKSSLEMCMIIDLIVLNKEYLVKPPKFFMESFKKLKNT